MASKCSLLALGVILLASPGKAEIIKGVLAVRGAEMS
jgi:hypothetical protein